MKEFLFKSIPKTLDSSHATNVGSGIHRPIFLSETVSAETIAVRYVKTYFVIFNYSLPASQPQNHDPPPELH